MNATHSDKATNTALSVMLAHLDKNHIRLEEHGCFVALSQDKDTIFWCPMNADGSAERDEDDPKHMNWGEVTAPDTEFLRAVNSKFGTSFKLADFAGR
jgi:hypothetical protein